jgi:hypothetical protein
MEIVTDFFNKTATDIKKAYFPKVKFYRDDVNCASVHYNLELFNNGCLRYAILINRLSKLCNTTKDNIKAIVDKYIIK